MKGDLYFVICFRFYFKVDLAIGNCSVTVSEILYRKCFFNCKNSCVLFFILCVFPVMSKPRTSKCVVSGPRRVGGRRSDGGLDRHGGPGREDVLPLSGNLTAPRRALSV